MTFNKRQFIAALKNYKEGILIGGVCGAIAAYYAVSQGQDLTTIAESGKGLLESFMSRSEPLELAKTKLYGTFISIGALIGFYADMIISKHFSKGKPMIRRRGRRRR